MQNFDVDLSVAELKAIKADLLSAYPHVKSSHRCETLARGLGCGTYASLLAAAKTNRRCELNAGRFKNYLHEHKIHVSEIDFYRSLGRSALRAAAASMAELTSNGFGYGAPRRYSNGRLETWNETRARFNEHRADLLESADEFLRARAFLINVPKTKTIRPKTSSYWLKHIAEKYPCTFPDGTELGPHYVSNGALIAAAIHLGFSWKKYLDGYGYDSLNVGFNMSERVLNEFYKRYRS